MDTTLSRQPNIFELLASDKLKDSLREAFRYLLNHLKRHNNLKYLPSIDETVLLIDLLIESSHLLAYRASYTEKLYNLFRCPKGTVSQSSSVLPSLVCLTIIPYLGKKIDDYFENLNYKETRTADELRRIHIYRLLTKSKSFINLICMLRFAVGQSSYHNIMNCITGVSLSSRTMVAKDMSMGGDKLDTNASKNDFPSITADSLGRVLTIGSYVIQFLDFWNIHSNSKPLFGASLPIPKPPSRRTQYSDNDDAHDTTTTIDVPYTDEKASSICLICEHVRQNECTLSNTGYVFCYGCIHKYVKTMQRCPITGNPATVDNIVKLYQDNHSQ